MVRFSLLVACFVLALAMSAISAPKQAKAHGGASVTVNGVTFRVNGNGGHFGGVRVNGIRVSGGHVSGFGPRFSPPNRFNQNGGVNRFGFRR